MLVSLIVPVRNEAETIEWLLAGIQSQTRHPDEVLIVDGGSRDETAEVVLAWEERHAPGELSKWMRVIQLDDATPGKGRNEGLAAASHEWAALTDAGIRLDARWMETLAAAVEADPSLDIVYGNYELLTDTFFERCAALAYPPPKVMRPGGLMRGPSTASMLVRRSVWQTVGGFPDLRAAEDLIFFRRIEAGGFKVGWAPQATVWWQLQPTLWRTFRKFQLYSKQNALGGQQRYWHYGVALKYVLALPFVLLAVLHHWSWAIVPVAGHLARAARGIWIRREGRSVWWATNPIQLFAVALILAVMDGAMFLGWGQAAGRKFLVRLAE
jgi:glycosyltransferase involved in cell wall biosynthesis